MVPLFSLWLPILVSAVIVFVASSLLHMLLPYHRKDFRKLPNEDAAREAIGKLNIPPGDYMLPCGDGPKAMKDPAFIEKLTKGPVAIMTVMQPGPPAMGKNLVQWFIYLPRRRHPRRLHHRSCGHARRRLPRRLPLRGLHRVHRLRVAQWQDSIWYRRAWSTTIKNTIDGLIYGLLTAGVFGWLWPR